MDQLRKKLSDFAETPPARVWSQVESALDQKLPAVSKKLSGYTSTPPPSVWKAIESGLDEKIKQPPVILFRKNVVRLAAAAAILFAVFIGVRYFTPSPDDNMITAIPQQPSPATGPAIVENTDTPVVEADPVVLKKESLVTKSNTKAALAKLPQKKMVVQKKTRYTTMSNDDGQTVRMSKKVAPVFNCAEAKILALSHYCQENIKLLQEKIGSSFASPSADFAGLIDLLQTLEDDK